jgi:galactokinase
MTGGGFGGCNLSLVRKDRVLEFKSMMKREYTKRIGYAPSFYQSSAGDGAGEVRNWRHDSRL